MAAFFRQLLNPFPEPEMTAQSQHQEAIARRRRQLMDSLPPHRLILAWPNLRPHIREAVMTLIDAELSAGTEKAEAREASCSA